jgi:hypothetical protein
VKQEQQPVSLYKVKKEVYWTHQDAEEAVVLPRVVDNHKALPFLQNFFHNEDQPDRHFEVVDDDYNYDYDYIITKEVDKEVNSDHHHQKTSEKSAKNSSSSKDVSCQLPKCRCVCDNS